MANPTVENIAKTNADALAKSSRAAEVIMKGGAEALTESGNASRAAIQELTKAYQELATKNAKNLTDAVQALVRREESDGVHRIAAEADQGRRRSCRCR